MHFNILNILLDLEIFIKFRFDKLYGKLYNLNIFLSLTKY